MPPQQRPRQPPPGYRPPARPPMQAGPPPRRHSWRRGILITLAIIVALLVGFALYVDTQLVRVDALPASSSTQSAGTNWLIVGSDSRIEETTGSRTDTIMLMHSGSTPSTLISLPRDSYLAIPGHGRDKLNAAFSIGGPMLLIRTVEQATGLHIDHFAEIGFGGFVNVVDAIGGVDMCIPESINDPLAALNIKAGCQQLDGATALGYVRTRATAAADLDRVQRQRAFLSALMAKATSPATLLNPFRLVPMANGLAGAISVDSGDHVWHLLSLALALRGVSNGGVTATVPIASTGDSDVGSVVYWDTAGAKSLFGALARDEAPPASVIGR
jgi:LCP family protein required for cell wall assembly